MICHCVCVCVCEVFVFVSEKWVFGDHPLTSGVCVSQSGWEERMPWLGTGAWIRLARSMGGQWSWLSNPKAPRAALSKG